jgi:predicted lipid-binding transport protein (Tim44 family)
MTFTTIYGTILQVSAAVLTRAGGGTGGGSSGGGGGGRSSGGGGGFSGGGSSSRGGTFTSGSGGSVGGAVGALMFGGICLFFIVIVILAISKSSKAKQAVAAGAGIAQSYDFTGTGPTGAPGQPAGGQMTRQMVEAGIAAIVAHDPAFNENDFLSDANRAFFTIQQAWTERKPDLSRQVMADGVWQQHKFQIDQYLSANKQNLLDNLAVQNAVTVAASSDASFDTMVVRFFASCADYDIDLSDDKRKVLRGSTDIDNWAEDWIFNRSSSATTKPDGGTLRKKCPNCGAPLDLDLAGTCKYCQAPVMSGEFDWVLSRIEQLPSYEDEQATIPH